MLRSEGQVRIVIEEASRNSMVWALMAKTGISRVTCYRHIIQVLKM